MNVQMQPPGAFCKKMCSWKFQKIHRKTPVPGLRLATLLKKRLWYRCFPVNVVKFRTHFLQNISGGCFWVSKYYDHDCSGNIPTKEMVNVVLMKWSKNKKQNKMDSDFLCILRILSNMYDGTFCNIING